MSPKAKKQKVKEPQALYTIRFVPMTLLEEREYLGYHEEHDSVTIEGKTIKLLGHQRPKRLQPLDFKTETTTLWSFPKRGRWATHKSGYRGNWAPQIARNIILRYSQPGDTVLDQMAGGGTTLVECKLTGRNAIGVDINRDALMLCMDRLNFSGTVLEPLPDTEVRLYQGDARNLDLIPDDSVDLIATHPPYANIIKYTTRGQPQNPSSVGARHASPLPSLPIPPLHGGEGDQEGEVGDLSQVRSIAAFAEQMRLVATECYRVLKPDHYCAILVGDTRRSKHYATIAFRVMQAFLDAGFVLKEDIIKAQWNTQTEGLWANLSRDKNFLLIMHEHLFVFRRPAPGEKLRPYAESMRWW